MDPYFTSQQLDTRGNSPSLVIQFHFDLLFVQRNKKKGIILLYYLLQKINISYVWQMEGKKLQNRVLNCFCREFIVRDCPFQLKRDSIRFNLNFKLKNQKRFLIRSFTRAILSILPKYIISEFSAAKAGWIEFFISSCADFTITPISKH